MTDLKQDSIATWLDDYLRTHNLLFNSTKPFQKLCLEMLTDFAASRPASPKRYAAASEQAIAEMREALTPLKLLLVKMCDEANKKHALTAGFADVTWRWSHELRTAIEAVGAALSQTRPDRTESSSRQAIAESKEADMDAFDRLAKEWYEEDGANNLHELNPRPGEQTADEWCESLANHFRKGIISEALNVGTARVVSRQAIADQAAADMRERVGDVIKNGFHPWWAEQRFRADYPVSIFGACEAAYGAGFDFAAKLRSLPSKPVSSEGK